MKEIYSFTVELDEVKTKSVKKTVINKETKKEEEVNVDEEYTESVPVQVIIQEPNRRQIEEADMEYSIEMSKCIKKGILTKAMLAKKYSDSGGLLTEEDATFLTKKYGELAELQANYTKLGSKTGKKTKTENKKITDLLHELAKVRREIVEMETAYSSVFNHTADTKAQNRVVLWYVLNLSHTQKEGQDEAAVLFEGKTFDEKLDNYYRLDDEGDPLYALIQDKLATYISYWYFSAVTTREDFEQLDKDIEEETI